MGRCSDNSGPLQGWQLPIVRIRRIVHQRRNTRRFQASRLRQHLTPPVERDREVGIIGVAGAWFALIEMAGII